MLLLAIGDIGTQVGGGHHKILSVIIIIEAVLVDIHKVSGGLRQVNNHGAHDLKVSFVFVAFKEIGIISHHHLYLYILYQGVDITILGYH